MLFDISNAQLGQLAEFLHTSGQIRSQKKIESFRIQQSLGTQIVSVAPNPNPSEPGYTVVYSGGDACNPQKGI